MNWDADDWEAAEWDEAPDETYQRFDGDDDVDEEILWTEPEAKEFEDFVDEVTDDDE